MTLTRRKVHAGNRRWHRRVALGIPPARAQAVADPARSAHRQDRARSHRGGIDMERALVQYLRERGNSMAGRKVDLIVRRYGRHAGDRAHQDAGAGGEKPRARLIGPLALEALAIDDYIRDQQVPILSVRREDRRSAKASPVVRATDLDFVELLAADGGYCAKTLKYKRMATMPTTSPTATR